MLMIRRTIVFAAAVFGLTTHAIAVESGATAAKPAEVAAQYWPQWRGPLDTGAAPSGNPPTEWNEQKNIKWKVRMPGQGSATPIVWGNDVFIQAAIPTGKKPEGKDAEAAEAKKQEAEKAAASRAARAARVARMRGEKPTEYYQFVLLCYDRQTGAEKWRKLCREEVPHEGIYVGEGSFAPASPITDGKHIYAFFGSRGLYCFDMAGNLKWEKDLGDMKIKNSFGEGSSPACMATCSCSFGITKGAIRLSRPSMPRPANNSGGRSRDEATSWTTPIFVEHGGKLQIITAATSKVRGYDAADGKLIWECAGLARTVFPARFITTALFT